MAEPLEPIGAENFLRCARENALQNVHHAVKVRERLIELAGGELGVVLGVHALVAENAADLVHALQTADDQALEVQLGGDAHIHINVERIVMRDERPRVRAARDGAEHGRLDLHEAEVVEVAAQERHKFRADLKVALALGIDDEVHVALTVAQLLILQTVEFFGQRPQGLREQRDLLGADAHLAALGAEHLAAHTDDVADVVLLEAVVFLLVHLVLAGVDLDAAGLVLHVAEGHLAHAALAHQAARHADGSALQGVEIVLDILGVMGHVKLGDLEGIAALVLQCLQLVAADLEQFAQLLLFAGVGHIGILLCHNGLLISSASIADRGGYRSILSTR